MRSVVLFRFHDAFEACRERIKLIRWLNPSIPIYGLYGGTSEDAMAARRNVAPVLDGCWSIDSVDRRWKWLHQDIAVRNWFARHGRQLAFDVVFDYEYDLLLARPLSTVHRGTNSHTVAFSGLKLLNEASKSWYWTSVEPHAAATRNYMRFMAARYGLARQTLITQGPFPVLPRTFLEAMADQEYPIDVFEPITAELSYPGMAEALGFTIVDTGLHPGWKPAIPSIPVSRLFHCERAPLVCREDILRELSMPCGGRAFHPVKECIRADDIVNALS